LRTKTAYARGGKFHVEKNDSPDTNREMASGREDQKARTDSVQQGRRKEIDEERSLGPGKSAGVRMREEVLYRRGWQRGPASGGIKGGSLSFFRARN